MKRCVLFLISLFWASFAFCQSPVRCEYWFDKNHSQRQQVDFTGSVLQSQFETEGLSTGIHTLNLHLQDSLGWCPPVSYMFLKLNTISDADTLADITYKCWIDRDYSTLRSSSVGSDIVLLDVDDVSEGIHTLSVMVERASEVSYLGNFIFLRLSDTLSSDSSTPLTYKCWFDGDYSTLQSGSVGSDIVLLDVDDVSEGIHTLSVMVEQASKVSYLGNFIFLRLSDTLSSDSSTPLTYKCWFDGDYSTLQSGDVTNGNILLETDSLETGLHTLSVMVGQASVVSYIASYTFLKLDYVFSPDDVTSATYTCWFDNDFASAQSGPVGDGNILLETNSIETGLHTLNLMVEVNGVQTNLSSYMFLKLDNTLSGGVSGDALSFSYWFDRDYQNRKTGELQNGNIILETDSLPAGIHSVNIQVNNSTPSALSRHIFFKEPLGGLGVCKYEYWLNEDFSSRTAVEVNPPSADYELVSLMPMDTVAFNPMSIYFDANEGNPIVYGENDIHFRFWNNLDFFTDTVRRYIDTRVHRDVVADTIERNTIRTFHIPLADNIKWYKLYAETGDSLIFKGGKACTIQLFSPSGDEVFYSSGSNSTKFNGCHAWEDGVYYLAIHSVTQSSSENTTIHYNHISKFALLAYTPDTIGNKVDSRFFMDYFGNGLDSLVNVFLTNLSDTIFYEDIVSHNICNARVQFLIDDIVPNGLYDLHLVFRDREEIDTIVWSDALNLQECIYGDLIVSYSSPSRVRRPYPVDVTIKNTGNIDYVYVPLNIAFTDPESIRDIKFTNFSISMSKEADSLDYNFAVLTDNLIGMNTTGCLMYTYIPILKANDAITLSFEVSAKSNANIDLYAWTGRGYEVSELINLIEQYSAHHTYYAYSNNQQILNASYSSASAQNILGFGEVVGAIGDLGGRLNMPSIGYAGNIADNSVKLGVTIAGIGNASMHIVDRAVCDAYGIYPGDPLYDDIMNLHPPIASPGDIGTEGEMLNHLNSLQNGRCDNPCPDGEPNGYNMHFYVPVDPNEIYGYVAESGSLCIKDSLKELNYEIEFENDTLFATAPAHTIVVKDTLNPNLFNLSTFAAHWVTIGERRLELNGEREFVYTMDMRPNIDAVAQIKLEFDTITGISVWTISSLNPITLEPATELEQGVLPINFNGDGIGRVAFSVSLKDNVFADSVLVDNYASIFFDQEDPIHTPVWRNIIDVTPPQSEISNISITNSVATLTVSASDNISGVWKYNVFAQYGATAEWESVAENIPIDSMVSVRVYDGLNTGFVSIAIDSAGNMENKPMLRDNDIFALHVYTETNPERGYVSGLGSYDSLSVVEITAVPNSCYSFVAWNDGNTDNPRTFTLTKDTCLTAIFESIDFSNSITAAICEGTAYTENGFNVSEAGVYTQNLQTINGCDSVVTLTLTVNPVATTNLTAAICEGTVYAENGFNVSEAGVYTQNLQTINGCDSTVTLTLTVNPVATTALQAAICEGTTYTENGFNVSEAGVYTQNLQTINGCDSTITLTLTVNPVATTALQASICEETTYTENGFNVSQAGVYTQNLQTINGCDSTVTLTLTVNPVATTALQAAICEGTAYTENGFNVSEAGVYTQNLQTINGCDSVVTLTLTVNPVATTALQAAICEGTAYTENGFNVSEAGVYTQNLQTINGCDSIVTLTLVVNPVATTNLTAAICEGTAYTENGFNVSEAGVYTQNLQTANGCDSTVTLTLTVNPVATTTLQAAICEGTAYTENGFNVSEAGVYTQNLQTINGCDSTITLTLTVNPVATTALQAAICEGTAYTENGFNVSEAGVYTQNLQTINGCDSTVTLTLTVNPIATTTLQAAICEGTAYTENGFNVSEAGVYTQNLQTINGCDSTVTLTLTVNPVATTALQAAICQGETYTENGFNVSQAGVYTQNLQTINGCDSTVTLTLTVNPVATTALQAAICQGEIYTENGFNVSEAGVYTQNLQTINGCDSVVSLTLTVNPVATTALQAAICQGETYTENGFNVSQAGVYTQNLQTINGCDSVVTLTLTVNPVYSFTIDATINQGETYQENGFEVSEAGTYTQNLQTVNGCDSVIVLELTVNSSLGDVVANTIEVALYPNPAENYTVLKVQGFKEQTKVALFDVRGRKLREFDLSAGMESLRIDLRDLPSGVYTLMIGNTTKKLIVE